MSQGATVVAVTSGANMNFDTLRRVSELADAGGRAEATLATTLAEAPGAFLAFVASATGGTDLQITELKYRAAAAAGGPAHVLWGAGVRGPDELAAVITRLADAGMPTLDLSGVEAAQVHLRHLVGGRAGTGVADELIIQVRQDGGHVRASVRPRPGPFALSPTYPTLPLHPIPTHLTTLRSTSRSAPVRFWRSCARCRRAGT